MFEEENSVQKVVQSLVGVCSKLYIWTFQGLMRQNEFHRLPAKNDFYTKLHEH